jgi:hypothetical protein
MSSSVSLLFLYLSSSVSSPQSPRLPLQNSKHHTTMPRTVLTLAGSPPPSERLVSSVRFIPHWLRKAYRSVKRAYENRKQEKASRCQAKKAQANGQTNGALSESPSGEGSSFQVQQVLNSPSPPTNYEAVTTEAPCPPCDTPTDPEPIPRTRFVERRERPASHGRQSSCSRSPFKSPD